jgi:uncharacterized protein (DUF2252 family)
MATAATDRRESRGSSASVAERAEAGKAARRAAPRSSHADWEPAADRTDPVEILERQSKSRVQELVPLRYGRMLVSAFTFYRGAAALMAADLEGTPISGFPVQACGDAHLSNFGGFSAPDRKMIFDINDFDETLPGPWEWDLKRLAASFAVAGRDRGFDEAQRRAVAEAVSRQYRETLQALSSLTNLDVWYLRLDQSAVEQWRAQIDRKAQKRFDRNVAKAQAKDRYRALAKLTHRVDGELRIVSDPPLIVPLEELLPGVDGDRAEEGIKAILDSYRDSLADHQRHLFDGYRYVHSARKVVGVGSVGTRAFVALFVGRDEDDPLFLQIKEAEESVLEPYTGASEFDHPGQRVVVGQQMMQAASDIFLGWLTGPGVDGKKRTFYVRQLWDAKGSALVEKMAPQTMEVYGQLCGGTLARAHARSGDRVAIAAYLGKSTKFDVALADFAEAYADQNERDYDAVAEAVQDGRLTVEQDPR